MQHSKGKIVACYSESIQHANKYASFSKELLQQPIAQGKWSIVEIIGHLIAWDEFVINKRVPFLINGKSLPASPSVEKINKHAAQTALNKPPHEVLEEFTSIRSRLIEQIEAIREDCWVKEFKINDSLLTWTSYFLGLIQHDEHHFKQCADFLNKK
ncbi:DinB family protein [Solibacillus sp. CAU 1738]|uniref:DinB family protein n=1 Tax=Solibacillus sp. CAU 1738 TaxID=3140363 RepID=UPI003260B00D